MTDLTFRQRLAIKARESARNRFWSQHDKDEYTCPICGYEPRGIDREFAVHHRDGDWLNLFDINLIAICHQCHKQEHRRRNIQNNLTDWKEQVDELGDPTPEMIVVDQQTGQTALTGWSNA